MAKGSACVLDLLTVSVDVLPLKEESKDSLMLLTLVGS